MDYVYARNEYRTVRHYCFWNWKARYTVFRYLQIDLVSQNFRWFLDLVSQNSMTFWHLLCQGCRFSPQNGWKLHFDEAQSFLRLKKLSMSIIKSLLLIFLDHCFDKIMYVKKNKIKNKLTNKNESAIIVFGEKLKNMYFCWYWFENSTREFSDILNSMM